MRPLLVLAAAGLLFAPACKKSDQPAAAPAPAAPAPAAAAATAKPSAPAAEVAAPAPTPASSPAPLPAGFKAHSNPKGFEIAFPSDWKVDNSDPEAALQLQSADELSMYLINVEDNPERAAPLVILQALEEGLGRKNQFEAEKTRLKPERLREVGADDGRFGLFNLSDEGGPQVSVRVFIFTRGTKTYVISETAHEDEKYPERVELFDAITGSFRIKQP